MFRCVSSRIKIGKEAGFFFLMIKKRYILRLRIGSRISYRKLYLNKIFLHIKIKSFPRIANFQISPSLHLAYLHISFPKRRIPVCPYTARFNITGSSINIRCYEKQQKGKQNISLKCSSWRITIAIRLKVTFCSFIMSPT